MDEWGFSERYDVAGRFSIADLVPKSKKRCGIYLLEFSNGALYVGQAVDVVRRFAQHRNLHDHIAYFRFRPVRRPDLNHVEQDLIHRIEAAGLPLTNRIHVSQVQEGHDLDDLISPVDQDSWLSTGVSPIDETRRVRIALEEQYRIRGQDAYRRFLAMPNAASLIAVFQRYIALCVPAPVRTEFTFWIISCLPATKSSRWRRYAAVSMNLMETLVVGYRQEDPAHVWALLNVSEACLLEDQSRAGFRARHPGVQWDSDRGYQAAGFDQALLHVSTLDALEDLLDDASVQRAARLLNLRLMQKGATVYSRFHSFGLADHVLPNVMGAPSTDISRTVSSET